MPKELAAFKVVLVQGLCLPQVMDHAFSEYLSLRSLMSCLPC